MAITFHPEAESLMSCSAGSQPEAFAAVMASHIALCATCRQDLTLMQEIGVIMLEHIQPTPVTSSAPVLALRASEAEAADISPAAVAKGDVPLPLAKAVGHHLDRLPWRRIAPGVWRHKVALSAGSRGTLSFIKVSPGMKLPEHGHRGSELTLVLRGSFHDTQGRYKVGDVADLCDDAEHAPVADAQDGCICLVATEGPVRFKSRVARLIQPFTGI